jgi:hypothetical protein
MEGQDVQLFVTWDGRSIPSNTLKLSTPLVFDGPDEEEVSAALVLIHAHMVGRNDAKIWDGQQELIRPSIETSAIRDSTLIVLVVYSF